VLLVLGVLALPCYRSILAVDERATQPLLLLWPECAVTVFYFAACWLVLRSRPAGTRWLRWTELTLILTLGLAARSIFFAAPPTLSHDAYRYVWDAHLLTHGLSPYTHTPFDQSVQFLHDQAIWPNLRFRRSPTIYPPGAQLLFLLIYLIKPLSIGTLKAGIEICDVLVALLTLLLLRRHGLDPRRVIIYWWSPIPIIEFAYSAHVDAAAIVWMLASLLVLGGGLRGAKVVAGTLLGLGALTKFYPALFALVLVRQRRDWPFTLGLVGTILLTYLAFLPFDAQSGGYLADYVGQTTFDRGIVLRWMSDLILLLGGTQLVALLAQGLALACLSGWVGWLAWRKGLRPEAGILALSVVWILLATHLFPWYVAVLLPLLALYLRLPVRPSGEKPAHAADLSGRFATPALGIWFFTLAMPFTYVFFNPGAFYPEIFQLVFVTAFALAALPLLTRPGRAALRALLAFSPPAIGEPITCTYLEEYPHDISQT
jgi:hypothetical protein